MKPIKQPKHKCITRNMNTFFTTTYILLQQKTSLKNAHASIVCISLSVLNCGIETVIHPIDNADTIPTRNYLLCCASISCFVHLAIQFEQPSKSAVLFSNGHVVCFSFFIIKWLISMLRT